MKAELQQEVGMPLDHRIVLNLMVTFKQTGHLSVMKGLQYTWGTYDTL